MSQRKYYLCEFRLDGRRLYIVWYSDDKDGLVRFKNGKIVSFAGMHEVREFCHANGMSLVPEPAAVYDFDVIAQWCDHPAAESIDPPSFLNAWNMLRDANSLKSDVLNLCDISESRADKVYEKLFFGNNLPAMTPEGAGYEPIWSQDEMETLSCIYRLGLAELRAALDGISH